MNIKITVAVTGLNATDNPAPGVAVIRALRDHPDFKGKIIGLAYDSLDPGLYTPDLLDAAYIIPYPSQGIEVLKARLSYIHQKTPIDLFIPTLDAELLSFIALKDELDTWGIRLFLPTHDQFELRAKHRLEKMAREVGLKVPQTQIISDVEALYKIHQKIPYPFFIKGPYYGAIRVHNVHEAIQAFYKTLSQWGVPVIAQAVIQGEEFNVAALGDGYGGLIGAVAMRKMMLTEKGKGWSGVTIKDPELLKQTAQFMKHTQWRGPCELEYIRDREGHFHLLEINPRFPAWIYLSVGAGLNLPYWAVTWAMDPSPKALEAWDYQTGVLFIRISWDQIATLEDFQAMAALGEKLGDCDEK